MCRCPKGGSVPTIDCSVCCPKLDLSKPVQTRDGQKVRILCSDRMGDRPVVGLRCSRDDYEYTESWFSNGNWVRRGAHTLDLVNVPVTVKKVLYLHRQDIDRNHYVSESNYGGMSIASKEVEFTIGEFVK